MFESKFYDLERARFMHMLDIPNADKKKIKMGNLYATR